MKGGVLLVGSDPPNRLAELAQLADVLRVDHVWVGDERFYRDVYGLLTLLAASTTRVRLGPCVTDPYSRHPALTAAAIATLDEISGGRAVLGIGAGISGFTELGIRRARPATALRETVELVRRLLAGEEVTAHGEVVKLEHGRLAFRSPRAAIAVYIASNSSRGQEAAGACADGAIMDGCANVEEANVFATRVGNAARRCGRAAAEVELVARLNACITGDAQVARDAMRLPVARLLGSGRLRFATLEAQGLVLPEAARARVAGFRYSTGLGPYAPLAPLITDAFVDALTLAGTADEVTERVMALGAAGIRQILIRPIAAPHAPVEETIQAFGEVVLPEARRVFGD
jgi:5,10-methylenetetrahydromethanopterin reductase